MKVAKHATERADERMGLSPEPFRKMAGKAFKDGITHAQANGAFKRYLTRIYLAKRNANNLRVYGEFVYLFHGEILITVYNLPNEFKEVAKKIKQRNTA